MLYWETCKEKRHGSDFPVQFQRHVYQSVWRAEEGENLVCKREMSNPLDSYTVIVVKGEQTVGPRVSPDDRFFPSSWGGQTPLLQHDCTCKARTQAYPLSQYG